MIAVSDCLPAYTQLFCVTLSPHRNLITELLLVWNGVFVVGVMYEIDLEPECIFSLIIWKVANLL